MMPSVEGSLNSPCTSKLLAFLQKLLFWVIDKSSGKVPSFLKVSICSNGSIATCTDETLCVCQIITKVIHPILHVPLVRIGRKTCADLNMCADQDMCADLQAISPFTCTLMHIKIDNEKNIQNVPFKKDWVSYNPSNITLMNELKSF